MANNTFANLQVRAREYLNEATAASWTDVELKAWLNLEKNTLALNLINIDASYLLATPALVNTEAGTAEYSLPSGYARIRLVERNDVTPPIPLLKVDIERRFLYDDNSRMSIRGTDPVYYLAGEKIGLIPTPTEGRTGYLKIHYNALPADMVNSSDTSGLPEILDEVLILGAVIRAGAKYDEGWLGTFAAMHGQVKAQKMAMLGSRVAGGRGVRVTDTY